MEIAPASIEQSFYGISGISPANGDPAVVGSAQNSGTPGAGAAYVHRGSSSQGGFAGLYGPDGRVRSSDATISSFGLQSDENEAADARMVSKLEARDRQVRQKAEKEGSVTGNVQFIYQTGPDGERYAIGSALHLTRRDADNAAQGEPSTKAAAPTGPDGEKLSEADQRLIEELKARDAKVRQHEATHIMAAGGQVAGGPTYVYQAGPDGRRYAVGGSVQISMGSFSGDPEETERSAMKAHRAAMATGEPSPADARTAQQAMSLAARARRRGLDAYARYALSPEGYQEQEDFAS